MQIRHIPQIFPMNAFRFHHRNPSVSVTSLLRNRWCLDEPTIYNCVVSNIGTARCWGNSDHGQLEYGNTDLFSNATNFGKNVDLGTGVIIESGSLGQYHSCFLSTDHQIKCFGSNNYGELGLGDTASRGDDIGEMGDKLALIHLGDHFIPKQIASGVQLNCALSMNSSVKCWGRNTHGQLGIEDTENRGDESGEMGNNLEEINFGDFVPIHIAADGYHSCAISEAKKMRCWGVPSHHKLFMRYESII